MLFQTTFKILNDVFFTIKTLRTDQRTFLKQCDESFFYTNINLQKNQIILQVFLKFTLKN